MVAQLYPVLSVNKYDCDEARGRNNKPDPFYRY